MTAINILHLSSSEVYGGNEEHVRICAKYADTEKLNIYVACPEGDFSDVLREQNIARLPMEMKSKFSFSCVRQIAKIVKEKNIHIVHSHNRRTDFFAYLSSFFCKPRAFATTVHDRVDAGVNAKTALLHAYILRSFFNTVYCVSQATRVQVIKFSGCAPEKVHAVTNGIDLNKFKGYEISDVTAKKKELGMTTNKLAVGMLARMRDKNFRKKAHPVFLRAAAAVLKKREDVQFVVAGVSETPRAALEKLCHELGISNSVCFLGITRDALGVLSCYDVFVLPSSYEGMPRTLADAMALGKPVVATQVDGVPELVHDGENGLLVPPADKDAMSEAILFLLEHPERAHEFGMKARERIFSSFGHERMVSQFETFYLQLTGEMVKGNVTEVPHLLNQ